MYVHLIVVFMEGDQVIYTSVEHSVYHTQTYTTKGDNYVY